jgi:hypothetical protein
MKTKRYSESYMTACSHSPEVADAESQTGKSSVYLNILHIKQHKHKIR